MGGVLKQERQEDKRKRFLTFLKQIKTWQLFLSLLPLLFLSATFLRFDHLKMMDLKTKVEKADEGKAADGTDLPQAEIDQNIRTALKNLRDFSSSHTIVNFVEKNGHTTLTFGTGPIYLEHQYNRQATVALREAESKLSQNPDGNPNGNIFAKAMETCKPQAIRNGWGWNSPGYLNCMTGVINSYPATDKLTTNLTADLPPTALYRYDFVSPIWTPSLSGVTVLLCVIIIITIVIRLIIFAFLRLALLFLK